MTLSAYSIDDKSTFNEVTIPAQLRLSHTHAHIKYGAIVGCGTSISTAPLPRHCALGLRFGVAAHAYMWPLSFSPPRAASNSNA